MSRNWAIHPKIDEAATLAKELKIHPIVAGILRRRGLKTPSEIQSFLNPRLESLESPFAFEDMEKAVHLIRGAISRREKILVYGDYDVDGITGSAILAPMLRKLGADVDAHIPHRMNEGYGLNLESLKTLLLKKYKMVITVDNGISGVDQVQFLKEQGVTVIIVDHHVPKDKLPPADAIVSGVIHGGQVLRSPQGEGGDANLAACGLAFKLAWALFGNLEAVMETLDLVTVGTVADLAPVQGDNRIILKHGLPLLSKSKRPGLKALMNVAGMSAAYLSYRDIAFGLGPRINASGRMGSPLDAFKLLTTENAVEAQNLAQILDRGNQDRQRVEADAFEEAIEHVEQDVLKDSLQIIVVESPDWHEGVLGIVASRLVERYHKPAIVISMKNGIGKGSGRSVPSFSIFEAVKQCEDLLAGFGGHAQACGLSIKKENMPVFRNRLHEIVSQMQRPVSGARLEIEAQIEAEDLSMDFLRDLGRLAPFGPGNNKPLFVSRGFQVRGEVKKRGKDTMQCWMSAPDGKVTCEIIGFRAYKRWIESKRQVAYDIVYQPTLKNFNGVTSIQLELEDWRAFSSSVSGP